MGASLNWESAAFASPRSRVQLPPRPLCANGGTADAPRLERGASGVQVRLLLGALAGGWRVRIAGGRLGTEPPIGIACADGGTGRRARSRAWCREAWGFESLSAHSGACGGMEDAQHSDCCAHFGRGGSTPSRRTFGPVAEWKTRRAQDALPAGMRVQLPPGLLSGAIRDAGGTGRRGRFKPGWFTHASSTLARPTRGPVVSTGKDGALQKRCSWFESRSARLGASVAQWMSSGLLHCSLQVRSLSDAQFRSCACSSVGSERHAAKVEVGGSSPPERTGGISRHPAVLNRPAVFSRLEQRRLSVRRARLLNGMRFFRAQVQFLSAPPGRPIRVCRRPSRCLWWRWSTHLAVTQVSTGSNPVRHLRLYSAAGSVRLRARITVFHTVEAGSSPAQSTGPRSSTGKSVALRRRRRCVQIASQAHGDVAQRESTRLITGVRAFDPHHPHPGRSGQAAKASVCKTDLRGFESRLRLTLCSARGQADGSSIRLRGFDSRTERLVGPCRKRRQRSHACGFESHRPHHWNGKPTGDGTGPEPRRALSLVVRLHPVPPTGRASRWATALRSKRSERRALGIRLSPLPPDRL